MSKLFGFDDNNEVASGLIMEAVENRDVKSPKQLFKEFLIEIVVLSLLTASIVMLWRDNMILFIVVLAECLAVLWLWHERHDCYFFLAIATLSTIAEVVFVHFQVWQYANPTFLGVPLWFPVAFGTAALTGKRFAKTLTRIL